MRLLSSALDEARARRLIDALLVCGIEAEVRREPAPEVWVLDDDALDQAREHLAAFERGELGDAAKEAARIRRRREASEEDWAHRFVDLGRRWHVAKSIGDGHGLLTLLLAAGSVAVALVGGFGDPPDERMWNLTIDHWMSTVPLERVRAGEVWRLVTPIFLHFGPLHLLFNVLWLLGLGRQVERNDGLGVMAALVLASAIAGNVGQYFVAGPAFGGLSGVVYGLFGFVWMQSRFRPRRAYTMEGRNTAFMMIWFVLGATGIVGAVANIGHAGGLAVGLSFGLPAYVGYLRARRTRPDFEEEGAWAAVHRSRWQRWIRRFVQPYVPLWFGLVVGVVVWREPRSFGDRTLDPCTMELERVIDHCLDMQQTAADQNAFVDAIGQTFEEELEVDATAEDELCPRLLERTRQVARRFRCDE